jgi:hypothetical protein
MIFIRFFEKVTPFTTILSTSFVIICSGTDFFLKTLAHDFSPDESANFLTLVGKLK